MKKYGIYICYPPTVELRKEGLGRYLAAFVKGAEAKEDVHFTIVCPSWSQETLLDLFESEAVPLDKVSICAPAGTPVILQVHNRIMDFKKARKERKKKSGPIRKFISYINGVPEKFLRKIEVRIAQSYNFFSLVPLLFDMIIVALVIVLLLPFMLAGLTFSFICSSAKFHSLKVKFLKLKSKISRVFNNPKDEGFVFRLYKSMLQVETERMHKLIEELGPINAWYSPTAFWSSFSQIDAPRLLCVPDVVLTRFPGGFSQIGGDRILDTFKNVNQAINDNEYFVTYSNDVKDKTLIEHYNVSNENVYVIQHAPNRLNEWLEVSGVSDIQASSQFYAEKLLLVALSKQKNNYVKKLSKDFKFIFYASQFRPNKNVISLLKAYNYLLKNNFLQHKLILTGSYAQSSEVYSYVIKHNLQYDVLLLSGLTVQELAACYKLADLAVNPTLSEGGCPFTFTEALSVGTPVVMGRIGVTEEVLTDPELQEMTFFDPYDWKSIADKIEWALDNLDPLREVQMQTYHQLMKRTWEDVVSEHIIAMDEIADKFHADRGNRIEQHR